MHKHNYDPFKGMVCFYLKGTTYSGNPVRTTLGNTLRSVMYMYFYAYQAGVFNFDDWNESTKSHNNRRMVWCIASGDDTVLWCSKATSKLIMEQIDRLTVDDKNFTGIYGLGQIIVEKVVSEWWNNEFCSKWFYYPEGGLNEKDWVCTRDVAKLFKTKMIYKGSNKFIHLDPTIHAKAILEGICSEVNSWVIQKMCKFRLERIEEIYAEEKFHAKTILGENKYRELSSDFRLWYDNQSKKKYNKEFFASENKIITKDEVDWDYEIYLLERIGLTLNDLIVLVDTSVIWI
jgi:hypothetical protein